MNCKQGDLAYRVYDGNPHSRRTKDVKSLMRCDELIPAGTKIRIEGFISYTGEPCWADHNLNQLVADRLLRPIEGPAQLIDQDEELEVSA